MHQLRFALFLLFTSGAVLNAQSPLTYVAPDAKAFFGVEVGRALASPAGRILMSTLKPADRKRIDDFAARTGFDPAHDLHRIFVSSPDTDGKENGRGLVVLEGNFNTTEIMAEAARYGRPSFEYGGVSVIAAPAGQSGWLAFPHSQMVLIGDESTVRSVLDQRENPPSLDLAVNVKLQELASQFDLWVYSTAPMAPMSQGQEMPGPLKGEVFQSIEQTVGGVRLGDDIEIEAQLTTKTEKDATELANVVRFFSSLMAMQTANPDATPIGSWLQSLQVQTTGRAVSVGMSIPQQDLETLLRLGREQFKQKTANAAETGLLKGSPAQERSAGRTIVRAQ